MSDYELWLVDDSGTRIIPLVDRLEGFFFSYTRAVSGLGTVNFGLSFREFERRVKPYFRPDWRIDIWRSPAPGVKMRREDTFMLRKPHVYTRDDGMEVIQFYGRNGIDLLMRRVIPQRAGSTYAKKTDQIDDFMKEIVRDQMLYNSAVDQWGNSDNSRAWPQNEFFVQGNGSLGPSITRDFSGRNVYDAIKELREISIQKNADDSDNRIIYFDIIPRDVSENATTTNAPLGWEFQTYADQRGTDRTSGVVFSLENENIEQPSYSISHLDEVNSVWVLGQGRGDTRAIRSLIDTPRSQVSRWNLSEKVLSASTETTPGALDEAARAELTKGKPVEEALITLLNTPGSQTVPRSLYGVDWDLGDLVTVNYAHKQMTMEINIVYVAVDDQGKEKITGRTVTR